MEILGFCCIYVSHAILALLCVRLRVVTRRVIERPYTSNDVWQLGLWVSVFEAVLKYSTKEMNETNKKEGKN